MLYSLKSSGTRYWVYVTYLWENDCNSSARLKTQDGVTMNGEASNSKKTFTTVDDVLKGLVEWLCAQVHRQLCYTLL